SFRKVSERVAIGLAGADAQRVIDLRDEDLAVADLTGARIRGDDLDRLVGEIGGHRDLNPQFWQEVHDIFRAAINLGVALLAAIAFDLGHRHAVDANGRQPLAHLVQFEGFDDRNDEFHGGPWGSSSFSIMRWWAVCANLASFRANGTKKLQR